MGFPSLKRTLRALRGGSLAESSVSRCYLGGFTFSRSYLGVATELGGAPQKQSCQEWSQLLIPRENSAWGRLPDGNVILLPYRTTEAQCSAQLSLRFGADRGAARPAARGLRPAVRFAVSCQSLRVLALYSPLGAIEVAKTDRLLRGEHFCSLARRSTRQIQRDMTKNAPKLRT